MLLLITRRPGTNYVLRSSVQEVNWPSFIRILMAGTGGGAQAVRMASFTWAPFLNMAASRWENGKLLAGKLATFQYYAKCGVYGEIIVLLSRGRILQCLVTFFINGERLCDRFTWESEYHLISTGNFVSIILHSFPNNLLI